jgi:hypothetical protein
MQHLRKLLLIFTTALWPLRGVSIAEERSEPLVPIRTVVIDDVVATNYATFFNVNQRVVETQDGIFTVYLKDTHDDLDQPPSRNHWILCRSTDRGYSFQPVYSEAEQGDTKIVRKGPEIIADDVGNLYLISCGNDYHVHVWKFLREDWGTPVYHVKNPIGGYAPKFSAILDPVSNQLIVMTAAFFMTIDPETGLAAPQDIFQLLVEGEYGYPQYSFLTMNASGRLYAGWHTTRRGENYYYDIHFAYADRREKFQVWRSPLDHQMIGRPAKPIVCDHTGPAPMVNRQNEVALDGSYTNGLNHLFYKGNALHFLHGGKCPEDSYVQSRYTRINASDPSNILRMTEPEFGGHQWRLEHSDGFFCSQDCRAETPLYLVSHRDNQIFVLKSADNGNTWTDYAASDYRSTPGRIYSVAGSFQLRRQGIIGVFTEVHPNPPHRLIFFQVPVEVESCVNQ